MIPTKTANKLLEALQDYVNAYNSKNNDSKLTVPEPGTVDLYLSDPKNRDARQVEVASIARAISFVLLDKPDYFANLQREIEAVSESLASLPIVGGSTLKQLMNDAVEAQRAPFAGNLSNSKYVIIIWHGAKISNINVLLIFF